MTKIFLAGIGAVLAVLLLAIGAFMLYMRNDQPQMYVAPAFDTQPVELPAELARPAMLVFSKTTGYRHHEGIPAGNALLRRIAAEQGWSTFFTESAAVFDPASLARFDVVVWNNATGTALTGAQQQAFRDYIETGGGYVGIHSAGDSSHADWAWYTDELIRARFTMHPLHPQFQVARLHIEQPPHAIVDGLPAQWDHRDEWYAFERSPRERGVTVLATLDESTYDPNFWGMGADHPIVWLHETGKGRVFYSALGHLASSFDEPKHQLMLARALRWAAHLDAAP